MVSIVENWALVLGAVASVLPAQDGDARREISVTIKDVRPVAGFPNLMRAGPGDDFRIFVQPNQLDVDNLVGTKVLIRVRLGTALKAFAHPGWRASEPVGEHAIE